MVGVVASGLVIAMAVGFSAWCARERSLRRTHPMTGGAHTEIQLPHTAEFELYHNDFSLCSKKIRMCLAELGAPYLAHHVDLIETGGYETLSRRFLAVNPAGLVPVLVHNGHPVYESHEILAYAAEHAGSAASLTPVDAAARAVMQQWIDRSSLIGDEPMKALEATAGNCVPGLTVPLFTAMMRDIPVHRIVEGLLFHRLKMRPMGFLAFKLLGLSRIGAFGPVRRLIVSSRAEMVRHLAALEGQIEQSGGAWITGSEFTLADVSWAVIFERLQEACWAEALLTPGLQAYWSRLRARPSYNEAMTAHRHPFVSAGADRIREEIARRGDLAAVYAL
ncbi:MAG: glutathione S-transferase family protein [Rhodoblastus sp.]|uniref:glutathione S-transferase family protein n=1 Tax=Rhodoblastus sp. TaxID=1962975 RepID=UPI003F951820